MIPRVIEFADIKVGMRVRAERDQMGVKRTLEGRVRDASQYYVRLGEPTSDDLDVLGSINTFTLLEEPTPARADGLYWVQLQNGCGAREVRGGVWIDGAGQGAGSRYDICSPSRIPTVPEGHVTIPRVVARNALELAECSRGWDATADVLRIALAGERA